MHTTETLVFSIFLIFTGAALLSTVMLWTRQSLLVAYMLLGVILGPWGIKLVDDPATIKQIGEVGIIFLLFLLGLHLHPQNLLHMLRKVTQVSIVSTVILGVISYVVGIYFGLTDTEAFVLAAAMVFSSTIIGLKLLPTTILHHQHTGEVMISVLLMQDIIAIFVLLILNTVSGGGIDFIEMISVLVGMPILIALAFLVEKYILIKLLQRFDTIQEYIFLVSIGWCLGLAQLAAWVGLSAEIGAFIAGVALAASPIALFIADSLRPLRDFFLVLFFFSIGASFNLTSLQQIWMPALCLALLMLLIKPILFKMLLKRAGESNSVSWEVGVRLGQASEFSLLVAYLATEVKLISDNASYLIQAATIITFIVSSYWVVWRYPTPIATSDRMRRD